MTSEKAFNLLLTNMTTLKQSYPFIYPNAFLTACVDTETNNSYILLEKINPLTNEVEFDDEIRCIHTVVYSAPISDLEAMSKNEDFYTEMLELRSTEYPKKLELAPEENFFALKSWVQGICEAGLDCFIIQYQFEEYYDFLFPLTQKLLSFLIKTEPRIISKLLHHIKKRCMFEGEPHFACLNANLAPILDILILSQGDVGIPRPKDQYEYSTKYFKHFHVNFDEYLDQILDLEPSTLLFLNLKYKFLVENDERIKKLPDYKEIEKKYTVIVREKKIWAFYSSNLLFLIILGKLNDLLDIKGLECLQELDGFSLSHRQITHTNGLQCLYNLSHLTLDFNQIRSLEGIKTLSNLKHLSLSSNKIEDITALSNLARLEYLDLSRNPLIDFSPLSKLGNLKELHLEKTNIEHISCLQTLQNLWYLKIGSPNLRNVDGIEELGGLESLVLITPYLKDIEPILKIPNLRRLSISKDCLNEKEKIKLSEQLLSVNILTDEEN